MNGRCFQSAPPDDGLSAAHLCYRRLVSITETFIADLNRQYVADLLTGHVNRPAYQAVESLRCAQGRLKVLCCACPDCRSRGDVGISTERQS